MSCLSKKVIEKYNENFIYTAKSKLEKQIYGANLNGSYNDGKLPYSVIANGLSYHLRYKFCQFGQLLRVITQRMEYIMSRDVSLIERYSDEESKNIFKRLQTDCGTFLKYLHEEIHPKWSKSVQDARVSGGIVYASQPVYDH